MVSREREGSLYLISFLPDGLDSVGHQSHLTSLDGMGRNGINRESWTDGLQTLPGRTFFTPLDILVNWDCY